MEKKPKSFKSSITDTLGDLLYETTQAAARPSPKEPWINALHE